MKVLLFGGCLSRDIFELYGHSKIEIIDSYAQSSFGIFSTSVISSGDYVLNINPAFYSEMLLKDLNKSFLGELGKLDFDILLIDFIDERFDLAFIGQDCVTLTNELISSGFLKSFHECRKVKAFSEEAYRCWEKGWIALIEKCKEFGVYDRIRLNKVFWADTDQEGNTLNVFKEEIIFANNYLNRLYERAQQDLSDSCVYSYPSRFFVADQKHKLGSVPFHYIDRIYRECFIKLVEFEKSGSASRMISYNPQKFNRSHFFLSSEELGACDVLMDGIYSLNFGDISLDWMYSSKDDMCGSFLVCFSGAVTGRKGAEAPFFSGINIASELGLPLLSFSDPTLTLADDIPLGWYAGNQYLKECQDNIARVIKLYADLLGCKPIIFGGSGGGFAALVTSDKLDIVHDVLVWNPQTSITEYNIEHVTKYMHTAFPGSICSSMELGKKSNLQSFYTSLLKGNGIVDTVLTKTLNSKSRILYFQNNSDWHLKSHATPYIQAKELQPINTYAYTSKDGNALMYIGNWGEGHVPLPKENLVNMLRFLNNGGKLRDVLKILKGLIGFEQRKVESSVCNFRKQELYGFVSKGSLHLMFHLIDHSAEEKTLHAMFAAYLYDGDERINRFWYQNSPYYSFKLEHASVDNLRVLGFIREGEVVQKVHCKTVGLYGVVDESDYAILGFSNFAESILDFNVYVDEMLVEVTPTSNLEFVRVFEASKIKNIEPHLLSSFKVNKSLVGASSVKVSVLINDEEIFLEWSHERLSLDMLSTLSDLDFMNRFTYASKRHFDRNVAELIAKNNLICASDAKVVINSTVVLTYKILERSFLISECREILLKLENARLLLNEMSNGFGARNDLIHLELSLEMAKCHVYLVLGDLDSIVNCASSAISLISDVEFKGYYAVNYSKIIMLGIVSAYRLRKVGKLNEILPVLIGIQASVDECIAEEQAGWLYSERKYVDSLVYFARRIFEEPSMLQSEEFITEIIAETVRIKCSSFTDRIRI